MRNLRALEGWIYERLVALSGIASVVVMVLIFLFLFRESVPLFRDVSLRHFLFGRDWLPISEPPSFGIVPLVAGTFAVTVSAAVAAVPIGVGAAVYLAEIAPRRLREGLKLAVELLAALPSVVIGFLGIRLLVPWVKAVFGLPTGFTALTGAALLALMALPTIISVAEDALGAVPGTYRQASYALGATRWETITRVVIPAARSGLLAAVLLGFGRVIGETMVVLMVTGNAPIVPRSLFDPARLMTATIAAEMGETVRPSEHYHALFAVGAVLFAVTFLVNLAADRVARGREAR